MAYPRTEDGKNRLPYIKSRPPPSMEAAEERLEILELEMAHIDAQIEYTSEDEFVDHDSYASWKQNAILAFGHKKNEWTFVTIWIRSQRGEPKDERKARFKRFGLIAGRIRRKAQEFADEMRGEYQMIYTLDSWPKSDEEAVERLEEITLVRERLEERLSKITGEWLENKLRRKDLPNVKRPLTEILKETEAESRALKHYRKEWGRNFNDGWKTTFLSVAARAIEAGMELEEDELEIVEKLREQRRRLTGQS